MLEYDVPFDYIDINGDLNNYNIIFKFNENNKNYIIYEDLNKDNTIYASLYEIVDDKIKLIPILNDEDYDIVDKYLESL